MSIGIFCVFVLITLSTADTKYDWDILDSALFIALSRPLFLFALILLWILLFLDNFVIIKSILSSILFRTFNRISFEIYLLFYIAVNFFIETRSESFFITMKHYSMLSTFNMIVCWFYAIWAYLLISRPFMSLTKSLCKISSTELL